jgi:diguanylate cyclase (GGDEF)-like protein/PAS domain S-box-containing protein
VGISRLAEALIAVDSDGVVTAWNPGARALYGRSAKDVLGRSLSAAVGAPVDVAGILASGVGSGETHVSATGESLSVRVTVLRIDGGHVLACSADSTDQQAQVRFRAILNSLEIGIVIIGGDDRIGFSNRAASEMLGATPEHLLDLQHSEYILDLPLFDTNGNRIGRGSHPLTRIRESGKDYGGDLVGIDVVDGHRVWVRGYSHLLNPQSPNNSSVLFSFVDVTDYHHAEQRLQREAILDDLTGLPNRGYALRRAADSLADPSESCLTALLFIDLDNLKTINDSYGHLIGDEALRIAARRLQEAARSPDVVARVGGDEFLVLVFEPIGADDLDVLPIQLHTALQEPVDIESATIRFSASIGITIREPHDERTLSELLHDADAAMYRAKGRGPGRTAYHR